MEKSGFSQSIDRIKARPDYDPVDAGYKRLVKRIEIEGKIARKTVQALLDAGYLIDMNDGEETTVENSRSVSDVMAAMFTTDEDYLIAKRWEDAKSIKVGWVRFIYGNDGPDVINDYTTNLEDVLAPVNAYADQLEERVS